MIISKTMLAGTLKNWTKVKYPVYATPKLDGIRCLVVDGKVLSRTFKDIPNKYIREHLKYMNGNYDGELICPGKTFNEIQSLVMRENGEPDFVYCVFDIIDLNLGYLDRMKLLSELNYEKCLSLIPIKIENEQELRLIESRYSDVGHEGVMIRTANSPYKQGRSTEREGYLLKIKRFKDSEAVIIGVEEKLKNNNEAIIDKLGYKKRSSHKSNLIPTNTLGSLIVRDLKTNVEFGIGSGFDDALKKEIWDNTEQYLGKIVTYKYQEHGTKNKPRSPIFKGFRDDRDL